MARMGPSNGDSPAPGNGPVLVAAAVRAAVEAGAPRRTAAAIAAAAISAALTVTPGSLSELQAAAAGQQRAPQKRRKRRPKKKKAQADTGAEADVETDLGGGQLTETQEEADLGRAQLAVQWTAVAEDMLSAARRSSGASTARFVEESLRLPGIESFNVATPFESPAASPTASSGSCSSWIRGPNEQGPDETMPAPPLELSDAEERDEERWVEEALAHPSLGQRGA